MKLVFFLQAENVSKKQREIKAAVNRAVSGTKCEIDDLTQRLYVIVPDDANLLDISDNICRELSMIGIPARPMAGGGDTVPPIRMKIKQKKQVPLWTFVISMVALALVVFVTAFALGGGFSGVWSEETLGTGEQEGEPYADKIGLVDSIFEVFSLYDTDGKLLLDTMLKAYAAASGDRYAYYYTAEEYAALMSDNAGNAVGIGILVTKAVESDNILIVRVIPDSPAAKAGLMAGDVITHIGSGESRVTVSEIGYERANGLLVGAVDSVADFTVLRGEAVLDFSVTRSAIKSVSVEYRISETDPTVGIIKIYEFNISTPVEFKDAMSAMKSAGCTKLVFDVRSNPGGDLNSISAVLSYFLEEGQTVLTTTYKDGSETVYRVEPVTFEGESADYAPCNVAREEIGMYREFAGSMVILTNGQTASAAELFTSALKDYGLARVVGETTFGKGIIQNVIPLENWGYEGAIKLTIGYYNPPISENYDGIGIKPDVEVSLGTGDDRVILELLKESEDAQLQAAISDLNNK